MFKEVPSSPDFTEMEHRTLERWERDRVFDRLRERNDGPDAPVFSFIDGPITANNPMGVHHAWGRAYKDIIQRYKAMEGHAQRYQNGFDCQGLWVEVEVEKELGLTDKGGIMGLGLKGFTDHCRARVNKYSRIQMEQSKRLGQWMDWDNSYYTMDNGNILHIWHFLKTCHERGWLYKGNRVMPWCCRCGTSLSQHELTDSYKDVTHTSAFVRFPLSGEGSAVARGESLLVWTTTPWTLPANTAVAVHPDLDYALYALGDASVSVWVSMGSPEGRRLAASGAVVLRTSKGSGLVGLHYNAPFRHLDAPSSACGPEGNAGWRVVVWDDVSDDDGTGLVHIAPGCGAEDHALGTAEGLPVLCPIDAGGMFVDGYGPLSGLDPKAAGKLAMRLLSSPNGVPGGPLLHRQEQYRHRYPVCWRCGDELVYRLEAEWFLSCGELREPMRRAAATVEWMPESSGKRMDDWLSNMGDWCISRKRYWGMPLPFYPCSCGHLTVVGGVAELRALAADPSAVWEGLDLHRPYIDDVVVNCPSCGARVGRVAEVGDCWLDAGIVPFSTLGYLDGPDGRSRWERWFPADFVCEMREQIRLWFYSQLFMSVVLTGRAPYRRVMTYEKVHDEKGRPMHKSAGNAVWFDDAVERMGADTMRWLYAARNPTVNLNFGFGEGSRVRARLITLWNVYSFLVTYARVDGWEPSAAYGNPDTAPPVTEVDGVPDASRSLDSWLIARTRAMVGTACDALGAYDCAGAVRALDEYLEDLSNWYVRRNRRRFWKSEADADKRTGYSVLHWALLTFCRVAAPIVPFLADAMWEGLVAGTDLPDSVHLTRFPRLAADDADTMWLNGMDLVRDAVNRGLGLRGASGFRVRQPLRRLTLHLPMDAWLPPGSMEIIADEVNVKEVVLGDQAPVGGDTGVWLDTEPDEALLWEGAARDLVRQVQALRKSAGFRVTDRISLDLAADSRAIEGLKPHLGYVGEETLCGFLRLCDVSETSTVAEDWRRVGTFAGDVLVRVGAAAEE